MGNEEVVEPVEEEKSPEQEVTDAFNLDPAERGGSQEEEKPAEEETPGEGVEAEQEEEVVEKPAEKLDYKVINEKLEKRLADSRAKMHQEINTRKELEDRIAALEQGGTAAEEVPELSPEAQEWLEDHPEAAEIVERKLAEIGAGKGKYLDDDEYEVFKEIKAEREFNRKVVAFNKDVTDGFEDDDGKVEGMADIDSITASDSFKSWHKAKMKDPDFVDRFDEIRDTFDRRGFLKVTKEFIEETNYKAVAGHDSERRAGAAEAVDQVKSTMDSDSTREQPTPKTELDPDSEEAHLKAFKTPKDQRPGAP